MRHRALRLFYALPALLLLASLWYQHALPTYTLREVPQSQLVSPLRLLARSQAISSNLSVADYPQIPTVSTQCSTASFARYTNATGQVAWSEFRRQAATDRIQAFLSTQGKTLDLGTLGGRSSYVHGLNAAGHVIGWSRTRTGEQHAYLWKEGTMHDLGTLGGGASNADALDDTDRVVGMAQTPTGDFHAFLWQKGQMTDLGVLPHGSESRACASNAQGQIVGWAYTESGASHAVIWKQGQIKDLNLLIPVRAGLVLTQATAIDAQGRIWATGERDWHEHTFLLTSNP